MRLQQRLDAPEGREQYGRRFAAVEPVFANVRYNKRLDRFTLHGCTKVNGQWLLFCLVHHIEKLTHAGYAASIARQETRAQLQNGAKRRRMPSEQRPALVLVASRAFCDTRHLGAERVETFSAASTLGYAAP